MKSTFGFLFLLTLNLSASPIDDQYANRIADAIWRLEGGAKTRYPYGIKSVNVSSEAEARQVCLNTIRNHYQRWRKWGRTNDYLVSLADRYCPSACDRRGNENWKRNIKALLHPQPKEHSMKR